MKKGLTGGLTASGWGAGCIAANCSCDPGLISTINVVQAYRQINKLINYVVQGVYKNKLWGEGGTWQPCIYLLSPWFLLHPDFFLLVYIFNLLLNFLYSNQAYLSIIESFFAMAWALDGIQPPLPYSYGQKHQLWQYRNGAQQGMSAFCKKKSKELLLWPLYGCMSPCLVEDHRLGVSVLVLLGGGRVEGPPAPSQLTANLK